MQRIRPLRDGEIIVALILYLVSPRGKMIYFVQVCDWQNDTDTSDIKQALAMDTR